MSFIFPAKLVGFFPGSEMAATCVSPFIGHDAQPVMHFDLSAEWHEAVLGQLRHARNILVGREASPLMRYRACTHLLRAWMFYVENIDLKPTIKPLQIANERIKLFTEFVDAHYGENIGLDDIAQSANASVAECARCFKKLLQITPYTYLMKYRIDKATELMRTTDYSVTTIAHAVGFGSASHLSTVFKKELGRTPSAYLKELAQNSI